MCDRYAEIDLGASTVADAPQDGAKGKQGLSPREYISYSFLVQKRFKLFRVYFDCGILIN